MSVCQHKRGEHNDDYRHCFDCGREWVRIGVDWFDVEAWVRISPSFLADDSGEPSQETRG